MSYQKNNTAHPGSTRDYKPRLTNINTWRLVVGVSFIFTAIVLVFFATTPNLSRVGGSVVAANNCPDVPPFSNYRGSTFDLKGNLAARGYTFSATVVYRPVNKLSSVARLDWRRTFISMTEDWCIP